MPMLIDVSFFPDIDQFNDFRVFIESGVRMSDQLSPTAREFHVILRCKLLFWKYKNFVLAEQLIDRKPCFVVHGSYVEPINGSA